MTTQCSFSCDTLNENNCFDQFFIALQNIQCKILTQIDNINFEISVEKIVAFQNAEWTVQIFFNCINVNKVACVKSGELKKIF